MRNVRIAAALLSALVVGLATFALPAPTIGGFIKLKDGVVYKGDVLRDNTIYTVFDGLSRVVVRDNRIEKSDTQGLLETLERIKIDQPLEVHAGQMPLYAIGINPGPWDDQGRRTFTFYGQLSKSKTAGKVTMSQAIHELYPDRARIRGITGFWQGQLALSQVPRATIMSLLSTVDKTDVNQRLSVAKFLIQAEWYDDALETLAGIAKDFPDQAEKIKSVDRTIHEWSARKKLEAAKLAIASKQPRSALARLKSFPVSEATKEDVALVRKLIIELETAQAKDRALAEAVRGLAEHLPAEKKAAWKVPLVEVLKGLSEAGDVLGPRLAAFEKSKDDKQASVETKLALAFSGWVSGSDAAVASLDAAEAMWKARELARKYLRDPSGDAHEAIALEIKELEFGGPSRGASASLEALTRIVQLMTPPLAADKLAEGQTRTHRVLEDQNDVPTEYSVLLPPEYQPARQYPAVLALHSGKGPDSAIEWWRDQAQKRGYIIIAPEYNLPDKKGSYSYSQSEHAAAILSLRDALKRYSIDPDRVFVGGQLTGADMALDLGLGHPDMFAGVVSVSGGPVKYVFVTKKHAKWLPIYSVAGDLTPYLQEVLFPTIKDMMQKYPDVTYVEYYQRGAEDFLEEAPRIFDWMDRRRREPFSRSFQALSARVCDDRFYGVVVDEFVVGRTTAPEAAEATGKNLRPATIEFKHSELSNLLNIHLDGINKLHVWVSPKLIDFNKRMEIRVNGQPFFKGTAEPSMRDYLDDLRVRGDRKQYYWLKVYRGGPTARDRRAGGDSSGKRARL